VGLLLAANSHAAPRFAHQPLSNAPCTTPIRALSLGLSLPLDEQADQVQGLGGPAHGSEAPVLAGAGLLRTDTEP